ncbi:unnamed protein product [Ectocarpus fasciculatus]
MSEVQKVELPKPDDFHIHLRDGDVLETTVQFAYQSFRRALVMPNTVPPIKTVRDALAYRERIMGHVPEGVQFVPLMTLYLTDATTAADIIEARRSGVVVAAKLYPHGVTTNSQYGVTALDALDPVFAAMEESGVVLCVHGEASAADIDVFDREKIFVQSFLPGLVRRFPALKIVLEHITTIEAADFVASCGHNVAATITPQHLLYNRSDIFKGGISPHLYCLPILKREKHRQRLLEAATSGSPKFFLGSDSAPHSVDRKESACGCAGVFSSHAALPFYAEAFDSVGKLDMLEDFSSTFGCRFYGLPRNVERVELSRESWEVPLQYRFGEGQLRPLRAGERVNWTQTDISD